MCGLTRGFGSREIINKSRLDRIINYRGWQSTFGGKFERRPPYIFLIAMRAELEYLKMFVLRREAPSTIFLALRWRCDLL